jgi:hypothetical protein
MMPLAFRKRNRLRAFQQFPVKKLHETFLEKIEKSAT